MDAQPDDAARSRRRWPTGMVEPARSSLAPIAVDAGVGERSRMFVSACTLLEVEALVADADTPTRRSVLRSLSDEFLDPGPHLSAASGRVFDEVIVRLVTEVDLPSKAELSRKLATVAKGPVRTVTLLAQDDNPAVAGPLLRASPLVSDAAVLKCALTKGQMHLEAIAGRAGVPDAVTRLLVTRGGPPVLRALAANGTAEICDGTMEAMVRAAAGDIVIMTALAERREPPRPTGPVTAHMRESSRDGLVCVLGEAATAAIDDAHGKDEQAASDARPRRYTAAEALVEATTYFRDLSEDDVVAAMNEGNWDDVVAVLAHLAGEPPSLVSKIVAIPQADSLLILMRVADLTWPVAEQVLTRRAHAQNAASAAGGKADYEKMSRRSAACVLRLIKLRWSWTSRQLDRD